MLAIHDSRLRGTLHARADELSVDSTRQWGAMSVDQMLWHLNASLDLGIGRLRAVPMQMPLPRAVIRTVALYFPWPRGRVQAAPELRARGAFDLAEERARFHVLVEEFASRPLDIEWQPHPMLGQLDGAGWTRLQAKHVDHHFRQFGV